MMMMGVKAAPSSGLRLLYLASFLLLSCSVEESLSFSSRKQYLDLLHGATAGGSRGIDWNRASNRLPPPRAASSSSHSSSLLLSSSSDFLPDSADGGDVQPQSVFVYRVAPKFLKRSPGGQAAHVSDKNSVNHESDELRQIKVIKR